MGFRTVFVTEDCPVKWPDWFIKKYQASIYIDDKGCLSSKREHKLYFTWEDLEEDIRKAIDWKDMPRKRFIVVYMHECGGIVKAEIRENGIVFLYPTDWAITDSGLGNHSYCYGCEDYRGEV